MDCVFPFTIGNNTYYDCTKPEKEVFNFIETDAKYKDTRVCATTGNFNADRKYKFCYASYLNTTTKYKSMFLILTISVIYLTK